MPRSAGSALRGSNHPPGHRLQTFEQIVRQLALEHMAREQGEHLGVKRLGLTRRAGWAAGKGRAGHGEENGDIRPNL